MEIKVTNGALLHKIWSEGQTAELLAATQYFQDAEALAELMVERDTKHQLGHPTYVVTCVYSGKMTLIRYKAEAA